MAISKIPPYNNSSLEELNVIIEVPMNSDPVKYEIDKNSGLVFVDRFLGTSMHYPCNYGFIPNTLADDNDPTDVLLISDFPLNPASVITARPIGVLIMEDESGMDEKILALPKIGLNSGYDDIDSYEKLPTTLLNKITHFFERYKDLEKNKWVKLKGFENVTSAKNLIQKAIDNYNSN